MGLVLPDRVVKPVLTAALEDLGPVLIAFVAEDPATEVLHFQHEDSPFADPDEIDLSGGAVLCR